MTMTDHESARAARERRRPVLRAAMPARASLLAALALGVLAAGSAVALLATSSWLIARAAEQPPDRLPGRLAEDVPERQVDGGDHVAGVTGLTAWRQQPVEALGDLLAIEGVEAVEIRCDQLAHGGGDDFLVGDRGVAVAHDPVGGLDFDDHTRQGGFGLQRSKRQRHRNVGRIGCHFLDRQIHARLPVSLIFVRRRLRL